jgi:hypothetical protein
MSGYLTGTRVIDREKTEEMSGENLSVETGAPIFSMSVCLGPPHMPSRWRGTSKRRTVASVDAAATLGRGLRDAAAGLTSDHARRGFLPAFPLLYSARLK